MFQVLSAKQSSIFRVTHPARVAENTSGREWTEKGLGLWMEFNIFVDFFFFSFLDTLGYVAYLTCLR